MDAVVELGKRHGGHHFVNVKYGYIVFCVTLLHVLFIYLSRKVYLQRWITSGRATSFRKLDTVKDTFLLAAWLVLLTGLSFFHFSPHEMAAFVKRLGRFSYVLIPFDIFLSLKPNPLPNVFYLELIFLHKWVSRLIVLLAMFHSIGFVVVWLVRGEGNIWKMFRLLNSLGVISFVGFLISFFVSLKFVRRRFYKVFFSTHLIIAWTVVILLQFHARPGVTFYTILNVILILIQFISKVFKSTDVQIEKLTKKDSSLDIVQFNNIWNERVQPGSHIRLSYSKKNPLSYILPSHPFTIASGSEGKKIRLVVRETTFNLNTNQTYSVFGPFPSIQSNFYKTADKVVLVAGGSGISLVLGIYEELSKNTSISLSLVWITRNRNDLWILDHFNIKKVDVYITQSDDVEANDGDVNDLIYEEGEQLLDTGDDSFELDELNPFDDSNGVDDNRNKLDQKVTIRYGRPDLKEYSHKFNDYDKANNWVISCGSPSLNKSCETWANELNVRFFSELYSM